MLYAARAHGRPTMVIAIMAAAINHARAIHRPPERIHSTFSRRKITGISSLLGENTSWQRGSKHWRARLPAPGRGGGRARPIAEVECLHGEIGACQVIQVP